MPTPYLRFTKDWNEVDDFPVVAEDAVQARANIQYLHDETKDYINSRLVPLLYGLTNTELHCWRVRDVDNGDGEPSEWRYLFAKNRDAYPDSGEWNGLEYEYLGVNPAYAVPPGGRKDQVLSKNSDEDYDFRWMDAALGAGLYPLYGDFAHLLVDSLSTARKIPRYLAGDTSDINYIDIRDRRLALCRAWTNPDGSETEQARDPDGNLLWWEQDISNADPIEDSPNGYPFIDGVQVRTTTANTGAKNRVIIYKYDEGDRWLQTFDVGNNFGPIQYWGEGYGDEVDLDRGKGIIQKLGAALEVYLKTSRGTLNGMKVGDDYTDVYGMRRTTLIDLSKVLENKLYEQVEGMDNMHSWTLTRDETNRPIRVTNDQDNHVCEVRWWSKA